jgi:hypothetical protein
MYLPVQTIAQIFQKVYFLEWFENKPYHLDNMDAYLCYYTLDLQRVRVKFC